MTGPGMGRYTKVLMKKFIFLLLLACPIAGILCGQCHAEKVEPYIQFLGAARLVGGSCYLIDTGKTRLLITSAFFTNRNSRRRTPFSISTLAASATCF